MTRVLFRLGLLLALPAFVALPAREGNDIHRPYPDPEAPAMTTLYWIGGLIAVALFAYLVMALMRPERF